jgi:ABC-2 type transport system permease protein
MWVVTSHELKTNILKKSFIIVLLIIPVIIGLFITMILYMESTRKNDEPVGYVDTSGILENPRLLPEEPNRSRVAMIAYENEKAARLALQDGQIQAYYLLPTGYFQDGVVKLVYNKTPGENATRDFNDFLQYNLLVEFPEPVARRLALGSEMTITLLEDQRTFPGGNPDMGSILPLILGVAFIGLIITGGGYILQAIFLERQNRTIEIISTSLSPRQIVWGKVFGSVGINLLQLCTWIMVAIFAIYAARNWLRIEWFRNYTIDWASLMLLLLIAIPSYIMVSALMFGIGSLVGTPQDAERAGPLLMLGFISPIYFFVFIGKEPQGSLAILLTLLPFTSLFTYGLRSLMITVPFWQVIASSMIQILAAGICLWFAMQAFRKGWLRPGFWIKERLAKKIPQKSTLDRDDKEAA